MITSRNILQHEIIGLHTKITESSDAGLVDASGKILDETRQTVTVLHENRPVIVPKSVAVFRFMLPNGEIVQVQGKMLVGRPEDRIKTRMGRHR